MRMRFNDKCVNFKTVLKNNRGGYMLKYLRTN